MNKIYISCPAYFVTGGTELLHQLAYAINKIKLGTAILYYCKVDTNSTKSTTADPFLKYVTNTEIVNRFEEVEDSSKNVLIVPEVFTTLLPFFSSIRKWIWWLSVDNFFAMNGYSPKSRLLKYIREADLHLYQSEYANQFLKRRGLQNKEPLSDFLNNEFFVEKLNNSKNKLSIVAYNPLKGYEFTEKLINAAPEIKWVPIEKMSAVEVALLLRTAKVYIDFGSHPGKDRIPREAAIQGCCIITGKDGAANNEIDVPIYSKYKFKRVDNNILKIIDLIKSIFDNYTEHSKNFEDYRKTILNEKHIFEEEIKTLLKKYIN